MIREPLVPFYAVLLPAVSLYFSGETGHPGEKEPRLHFVDRPELAFCWRDSADATATASKIELLTGQTARVVPLRLN